MWDQRYGEPGYAYGTAPNDFLAAHAARYLPAAGEVLCLAEGEGRNAVFLGGLGFRVTGVDGSAVGLEKARHLAAENGVEIQTIVADLDAFDLGVGRWDGIVSILVPHPAGAPRPTSSRGRRGAQARRHLHSGSVHSEATRLPDRRASHGGACS